MSSEKPSDSTQPQFTGHIYIFHSFDVGDDIDFETIKKEQLLNRVPHIEPRYFKEYHTPLEVEPPHPHTTSHVDSAKLHNFGAITIRYKVPFTSTLEKLRGDLPDITNDYKEQSIDDGVSIFKAIKQAIRLPHFYHMSKSYVLVQIDPQEDTPVLELKQSYDHMIASMLRFETENLSEYKKDEIFASAFGYYRGDLIVIDTEAACIYDDEYNEILDLFEFVNMQHLELQYFDRVLNRQLNRVYEDEVQRLSFKAYIPMWGTLSTDPIGGLSKLKVDISVITERLENSIKLAGDPYYTELYNALIAKLDVENWKDSIQKKLSIIQDISNVHQNRISTVREDLFNLLIVILIFFEFIVAILHYYQG